MVKKIFNNTKRAFSLKSDEGLKRSIFIFEMLSKPFVVKIGTRLTNWALKIGLPIGGIIKKTIFWQFCGGVSEEDCLPVIEKIYSKKVYSLLIYSTEGKETEEEFDRTIERKIRILEFASKRDEIPFAVFKPTGIGRLAIWEKVSNNESLNIGETQEWQKIKARVHTICKAAAKHKVRLLADAEESWMQDAADELMEKMMGEFNQNEAIIYNTIQCYRHDRMAYVKSLHQHGKEQNFKLGLKIVRGAYMEKENERAQKMGHPTPICEDKEATDVNFNAVLSYSLEHIGDMEIYVGTHNEVSTYLAMQLMEEKGLSKNDPRIWFSQLYGMSDHISFNLALEGYNTSKYIPFGPVREVVPYLIRRARENTSVKGQTSRELSLLREEKKRREGNYVKRIE